MSISDDSDGLYKILQTEKDAELRSAAIQGLAINGEEKAADYLVTMYPGASREEKSAVIQSMMIMEDTEGLLSLLKHDFFICRTQGIPNGEAYIAVSETELREMWQGLQTIEDGWDKRQDAVWDAHFLATATGHAGREYLTGVISPIWPGFINEMTGDEWGFHIGLEWQDNPLPLAARRLINLIQSEGIHLTSEAQL